MSGFEITGVILGVIPLIIEAFNRSEQAFAAFATYRRYPKELAKLDSKLGAQKTVFRNNCINLLTTITNDRQKVHDMLSQPSHEAWQDNTLHQNFKNRVEALDQSFESCQRTMEQIYEALQSISRETEGFKAALVVDPVPESISSREWCRRFGQRMKLGFQKPQIEQHIEELRSFNSDFNIMCNQVIKSLQDAEPRYSTMSNYRALSPGSSLVRYHNVRKASQKLYETLVNRWSCSIHPNHSANISVDDEAQEDDKSRPNAQLNDVVTVHFEMAVTCYAGSPTGEFPIWLEIESVESTVETFQGHLADTANQTYEKVSNLLQSRASAFVVEAPPVTSPDSKKRIQPEQSQLHKKKAVRFETTLTMELESLRLENAALLDNAVPDLCLVKEVCDHFQKQQKRSQHHACMGYLKDSCIQRFYQPPAEKCVTGEPKSLAEVISWISEDPVVRNLPRSVMIQLAGSLAAAVLQYHSTPWLSETWKSQDIVFFGIDNFRQGMISLTSPHLNIEFSRQKGKQMAQIEGTASVGSSRKPNQDSVIAIYNARNELLFRLGIVLLEIGFARPWPMLRESVIKTLPENKSTDYHVAEKLACLLVNTMGPKYPRIIRKCLGCDFGLGESDLESEELQASFFLDVVVALKALGQRLPKF